MSFEYLIMAYQDFFDNKKDTIIIDSKETKELRNVKYSIDIRSNLFEIENKRLIKAPLDEEVIERDYILRRSKDISSDLVIDLHSRRASFCNNYDGATNHCISYFHFYVRNYVLYLNVYCRSMNFDTNFIYDNQTFMLAYNTVFQQLLSTRLVVGSGEIDIHIMSLHKIV